MTDVLLDTCAAIWIAEGHPLNEPGASELPAACERGARLVVSPITAWEIAMLAAKGRIALALDPHLWFERFCDLPALDVDVDRPRIRWRRHSRIGGSATAVRRASARRMSSSTASSRVPRSSARKRSTR